MSLSFSIKFFLNERAPHADGKVPIYVRIRIQRKKAERNLFMYVEKTKWDVERGRIKVTVKHDNYLNKRLNDLENKISGIYYELEHARKPITSKIVMNIFKGGVNTADLSLLDFFSRFINEHEKRGEVCTDVIKHYRQCHSKLLLYLESIGDKNMLLRNFKCVHVEEFENFLLALPGKNIGEKMKRNTVSGRLKKLRAVFRNAKLKQQLTSENPFDGFKIKMEKTNPVYLTQQEIDAIENHPLGGNESLLRVKDRYLFSCYTGIRFSDLMNLTEKNVVLDKDRYFILGVQLKTKRPIEIPMIEPALKIFKKYEAHRKLTGYAFPKISNQKINVYLKTIAELCGIEKNLVFHSSRHSFAVTILLANDVDIFSTSYLLGHCSLRTTGDSYAKMSRKGLLNVATKVEARL